MQYSTVLVAAMASLVSANIEFTMSSFPTMTAGAPFNITWSSTSGPSGTVSLILRQGNAESLTTVATVASSIQNTGSYLWTPSNSVPSGANYALEIVDDEDKDTNNYSNKFSINSDTDAPLAGTSLPETASVPLMVSSAATSLNATLTVMTTSMSKSSAVTPSTTTSKTTSTPTSVTMMSSDVHKNGVASQTTPSTATGTHSGSSSTATKNAAARLYGRNRAKVAGALLGVVGAIMLGL